MDQTESKRLLTEIDGQIPNPYFKHTWYDVTMPNGKPAQAMRTKTGYLKVRKLEHMLLKTSDGVTVDDLGMEYAYYRCNLWTGEITKL